MTVSRADRPAVSRAPARRSISSCAGGPETIIVVTVDSRHFSRSSRIFSFGPISATSSTSCERHRGRGLVLAALEIERLDVLGFVHVAHADEHLVVEVDLLRTHAADVERERGPVEVRGGLDVVGDDDRHVARDLEVVGRAARVGTREALRQRLPVEARRRGARRTSAANRRRSRPPSATFFGPSAAR